MLVMRFWTLTMPTMLFAFGYGDEGEAAAGGDAADDGA
jgi:hypothetical protein